MKTIRLLLLVSFVLTVFQTGAVENTTNETAQPAITVTTVKVFEIKSDRARCSFTIQGAPVGERGVCFSEFSGPEVSGKKSAAPGNTNNGNSILVGLKANTIYFVRAYAKSGTEVIYGNELSFTTLPAEEKPKSNTNVGQKVEKKESNTKK